MERPGGHLPVDRRLAAERGERVVLDIDGQPVVAYPGETIAAALMAHGWTAFRRTPRAGALRGVFCGIGVCFDCLVGVEGVGTVRACLAPVRAGLRVHLLGPPGQPTPGPRA